VRPGLLFIVNSLGIGGAEKQVVTLLNHLDPTHFRLHLAYLKPDELLLPQLQREKLDEVLSCDVRRPVDRAAVGRLRSVVAARQIDAIVCTNSYSMLYGHLARGSNPNVRLVTVFHTTKLQTCKEKAQMLLYRQLFKRCDLLVYVCENQRRHWREQGLRPIADQVVYNGIDTCGFTEGRSSTEQLAFRRGLGFQAGDFVIGLCSGLRPEKAHGDLLAAIAKLRARGVAAKGLLIGDGPERPAIERTITRLDLQEHVRITGVREDVRAFVSACDVMTLVSRTETFSLAALESMSLGKPLVMSDIGGASEQVIRGRTGYLFPPGDIEMLAKHLEALTSPALRARLGEAAARRVRDLFTVQGMAARFTDCMDRLLEGRAPTTASGVGRRNDLTAPRRV
jgi:glycosyltransferase involved in cell wall biosynthesis